MANSSHFNSVAELQGPGGRGRFLEALREPLADGSRPNLVFSTLVETRLNMSEWVQEYMAQYKDNYLDAVLQQNARREGAQNTRSRVRSWMEGLAATYNGNLKSMLAYRSDEFHEDQQGGLFGRLTETRVAGLAVPNPKKAFMGRSIVETGGAGIRFCFVGAHFPLAKLAAAIEDPTSLDPLEGAKVALARTLRKVLKKASRRGLPDQRTAIFIQGDLNSRTVLRGGEVYDVLMELMRDTKIQAAIQHELQLPPGRWREVAEVDCAHELPVTYKFQENLACSKNAHGPGAGGSALTIGDVVDTARLERRSISLQDFGRPNRFNTSATGDLRPPLTTVSDTYKRTLTNLGDEQLASWGVAFKKHDFRAFRFPACADRVIYWAPDALADRMTWEFPRDGYEVNHLQLGSDHRPVALEAILRVGAEPVRESPRLPSDKLVDRIAILLEDSDGSDGEGFNTDAGNGLSP